MPLLNCKESDFKVRGTSLGRALKICEEGFADLDQVCQVTPKPARKEETHSMVKMNYQMKSR